MSSLLVSAESSASEQGEDLGRFYAHLADGLHAMAQPLTILRSSVAASTMPGIDADRHRRYLDISKVQVERACGLFESLQDLVIARLTEARCGAVDIENLATRAIEDQKAAIQSAEVSVAIASERSSRTVFADAVRTAQAFDASLKIALSVSSPGDVIQVGMSVRDEKVECMIQNRRVHGRDLDSAEHLSLALAEANIRSQRGEYRCVVDPFCVSFTLPIQSAGKFEQAVIP